MARRRNKGRLPIIIGKPNNVAKSHNESKTTRVVLTDESNTIIVNTTTVGDLSKHKQNVFERVEQAIKIVKELDLSNAREKVAQFCSVDEQWTKVMGTKAAKAYMAMCRLPQNRVRITKKPLSFTLSKVLSQVK